MGVRNHTLKSLNVDLVTIDLDRIDNHTHCILIAEFFLVQYIVLNLNFILFMYIYSSIGICTHSSV